MRHPHIIANHPPPMRILLIVLLVLAGIANVTAALPILGVPAAPIALKVAPFVFALCALISAGMLMRRSRGAIVPFLVGFLLVLGVNLALDGLGAFLKSGFGFAILVLFFLPGVRNPEPAAQGDEARDV